MLDVVSSCASGEYKSIKESWLFEERRSRSRLCGARSKGREPDDICGAVDRVGLDLVLPLPELIEKVEEDSEARRDREGRLLWRDSGDASFCMSENAE